MITDEYRELNRQLHADRKDYGRSSSRWAPVVMNLCSQIESTDVLDYGCGKAELNLHLPFELKKYDPAIKKYEAKPEPADIVVCTDVMEHVEPQFIDNVLDDLVRLSPHLCLLNVATRLAVKTLADGRNAHISHHPIEWWMPKIRERWEVLETQATEGEFTCTLKSLGSKGDVAQ